MSPRVVNDSLERELRRSVPGDLRELPSGTVTFLLTDVEGSTPLWEQHPKEMRAALARHDALIERYVQRCGGLLVRPRGEGDSRFAVFTRTSDGVAASYAIQLALVHGRSGVPERLKVRMALYTGETEIRGGDYYGTAVNRCAHLRDLAHGEQILLSGVTARIVRDHLPPGVSLRALGKYHLKGVSEFEEVFQLVHAKLPADFPPLPSAHARESSDARSAAPIVVNWVPVLPPLPASLTSFVGREHELDHLQRLLRATRLLTLTGASGIGKTRLGLKLAGQWRAETAGEVAFVDLSAVTDASGIEEAVAKALGIADESGGPPLEALVEALRRRRLLLVLDSCENVAAWCGAFTDRVLERCPDASILALSFGALGTAGECSWCVPALAVPEAPRWPSVWGPPRLETGEQHSGIDEVARSEAVRLFLLRAAAVQPGVALTEANAPAVAQICRQLGGVPQALELAAARVNILPMGYIAEQLKRALEPLAVGRQTPPDTQQIVHATIEWSYLLLSDAERRLFERLAIFDNGGTLEAATMVCAGDGIEASCVHSLIEKLTASAFVIREPQSGSYRYLLPKSLRQYAKERLSSSRHAANLRKRYLEWQATAQHLQQ